MTDQVTIYHNPRCSKSRAALALLEEAGCEPEIVLYLDNPPTAERLGELLRAMDMSPRELMRKGEARYQELGLNDTSLADDVLIEQMAANPILIERAIVVTDKGVRLCRPPELVHELIGKTP